MSRIKRALAALTQPRGAIHGASAIAVKARGYWGSSASDGAASDRIPLVHRVAILYLILPVAVWLVGWFEWWFGVPAAVLLALGLSRALVPSRVSLNWQAFFSVLHLALRPTTAALLLISFAWVMTTAAGGVFDVNNTDWPFHRSIFLDLSDGAWPSEVLPDAITYLGVPSLLRHYLGYYMVPGLLGNWFGQAALNWAVPLWTWSGVALILLMFNRGRSGWKAVVAALILIFFSGMDALRIALVEGWDIFEFRLILEGWPRIEVGRDHLEWEGLRSIKIQFSSHMVGLMFVPKHFIAAALYALLLLQLRRDMPFIAVSGVVLTAALFWSPFVAVGLLPFVAVFIAGSGIRPFLSWQNLLIALPLAILLLVYLSSGSHDIPRGWFWNIHQGNLQEAIRVLLSLYLSEFLILAIVVLILRPRMRKNPFFVASLATLLFFPLYSLGLFNDLVMRGVMPALFILCYYCADTLVGSSIDIETRGSVIKLSPFAFVVIVLAIGAVTPLVELTRANNNHEFGLVRHEQLGDELSIRGILEENYPEGYVPLYLTNEIPDWYLRLMGHATYIQPPATGDLVIRSTYDVYFDGRTLIYKKDSCSQEERGTYFFVQVVPLDQESLPNDHVHFNMDFVFTAKHALRKENTCLAYRTLPDTLEVAYIKTGQLNAERASHSWIAHYYSPLYRDRLLAEAGEPIIRSFYEVYLHQEQAGESVGQPNRLRLLYFKPACSQDDYGTRFFMHVIPRSAEDLPNHRKEAGYEELDFALEDYGGRYGGDCFAIRNLPEYDILEIRTGQTTGENSNSWQGSFTLGKED